MKPTRLQVKHFSFFFSLQENSLFWHFDVTEFAAIIQKKKMGTARSKWERFLIAPWPLAVSSSLVASSADIQSGSRTDRSGVVASC